jgi:uncharacterized protein YecE (DUF72 family)
VQDSAPTTEFDVDGLRARVTALAERGIYIGTSSWKYQGWLGQIYTRARYEYRGRFAETRFERECLREYSETFRTVCFDGAYYGFPEEKKLQEMADQVPENFKFAFKVTDEITIKRFPSLPRFGLRVGATNENFLQAPLFVDRVLGPLATIRPKVGPIIFEFSKFYSADYANGSEFIADLNKFFGALPKGWNYSVELRNRKWLGPEYLECLKKHEVAHTFNSWTDMPAVSEQLGTVGDHRAEHITVARFLLKPGRKYEEAVSKFQPYTKTGEISDEGRAAIAAMVEQGWLKPTRNGTYLYINNRLEGNALQTVLNVLALLKFIQVDPKAVRKPTPAERGELF